MGVQTQTCGERFVPPVGHTAVGAAEFAERTVVIALSNSREAKLFIEAYERMGFRVIRANDGGRFLDLVREGRIDLFVTDRLRYIAAARMLLRGLKMPRTCFVASDTSSASVVWAAGAEAIMVRSMTAEVFFSYEVVQRPDA